MKKTNKERVILNTTLTKLDSTDEKKSEYSGIKYFFKFAFWLLQLNTRIVGKNFIIYAILRLYSSLDPLLYMYLIARLIDSIVSGNQEIQLRVFTFFMIYLFFTNTLSQIRTRIEALVKMIAYYQYSLYFTGLFKGLGLDLLENPEYANKIFRVRNSNDKTWDSVSKLIELLTYTVGFVATVIIMFNLNLYVGIAASIIIIIRSIIHNYELIQDWKFTKSQTENTRIASNYIQQLRDISSLRNIIIDNSYEFFKGTYKKFYDYYYDVLIKMRTRKAYYGIAFEAILLVVFFFLVKDLINQYNLGLVTIGAISFGISSYFQYTSNMKNWTGYLVGFNEGKERLEDAYELEKKVKEIQDLNKDKEYKKITQIYSIEISDLSFTYPGSKTPALENISMKIQRGDNIAIVGDNGAGKTTLFNLILGVYKVERNKILINGIDINDIDVTSIYETIAVLSQTYNRYEFMNVRDNIILDRKVKDSDISDILESVKLTEEMSKYSEYGYDQILGQDFKNGVNLSGGQWQKLAIARVLAKHPDLVFFDEPTSAIDSTSEATIINNLFNIFTEKTMLLISHRFSTLKRADYIYVLEKGKIIEKGKHKELMDIKGKYYDSYTKQANMYLDN